MSSFDWRHAKAADAVRALDEHDGLTIRELHAALANALERIAILERERDELAEFFKAFNEAVDASKLHGRKLIDDQ